MSKWACYKIKEGSDLNTVLKFEREKKGLTQWDVAKRAGISIRSYQRYEAGNRVPDVYQGQLIAKALGTTVEELWGIIPTAL